MTLGHENPGMGRVRRSVMVGTSKDAGGRDACSLGSPNPALVGLEVGTSHAPVGLKGSVEPKFFSGLPHCVVPGAKNHPHLSLGQCAGMPEDGHKFHDSPSIPKERFQSSCTFTRATLSNQLLSSMCWCGGGVWERGAHGIISEHSGWLLGSIKGLDSGCLQTGC